MLAHLGLELMHAYAWLWLVDLPLREGRYSWSNGNFIEVFDATVVAIETDETGNRVFQTVYAQVAVDEGGVGDAHRNAAGADHAATGDGRVGHAGAPR